MDSRTSRRRAFSNDLPWTEWKAKLEEEFSRRRDFVDMLEELVNVLKLPSEKIRVSGYRRSNYGIR